MASIYQTSEVVINAGINEVGRLGARGIRPAVQKEVESTVDLGIA